MSTREVMVVSGTRTAIGDYGGSLKDMPPTKLGAIAIKEAVARAKVDPASVGHVVIGSVIHGEARDMYISRVAAVEAGIRAARGRVTNGGAHSALWRQITSDVLGLPLEEIEKALDVDLDGIAGAGLLAAFRCTLADGGRTLWLEDTMLPPSPGAPHHRSPTRRNSP